MGRLAVLHVWFTHPRNVRRRSRRVLSPPASDEWPADVAVYPAASAANILRKTAKTVPLELSKYLYKNKFYNYVEQLIRFSLNCCTREWNSCNNPQPIVENIWYWTWGYFVPPMHKRLKFFGCTTGPLIFLRVWGSQTVDAYSTIGLYVHFVAWISYALTTGSEITVQESSNAICFLSDRIDVVIEIQFGVNGHVTKSPATINPIIPSNNTSIIHLNSHTKCIVNGHSYKADRICQ